MGGNGPMRVSMGARAVAILAMLAAAACAPKEPKLLNLKADNQGPDEFLILPTKPLQAPESYDALPAPTPGAPNLVDPTPFADAATALGGRAEATRRGNLKAGEQVLVTYAARHGIAPDIREVLAAEDLEWRRKHNGRLLERLFNVSTYYKAYRPFELDQYRELRRLRRADVWTPTAPPDGAGPR